MCQDEKGDGQRETAPRSQPPELLEDAEVGLGFTLLAFLLVIRLLSKKLGEPWRLGIEGERDFLSLVPFRLALPRLL